MTPFGFCSCKRCRHSTIVSCQSQDLQNQVHTPAGWPELCPKSKLLNSSGNSFWNTLYILYISKSSNVCFFPSVSSLDELTRVRLFWSLLIPFLGTDQTKLDINTWPGEKEHVLCQSSLFISVFFYLQAHCFKQRGVKQDYDSSKSVFFSQQIAIIWKD